MAIGLGLMFGFHFLENFNYPYISKSVSEFWRRWHISLGSWFRDYVYIPLGGNRVSPWKQYRNLGIVWMLTGLWHGASWTFVAWGVYYGIWIMLEKAFLGKIVGAGSRVGDCLDAGARFGRMGLFPGRNVPGSDHVHSSDVRTGCAVG